MDEAEGELLSTAVVNRKATDVKIFLERSARWLVKLHRLGYDGLSHHPGIISAAKSYRRGNRYALDKEEEIASSIIYTRALRVTFPSLSEKIDSLSKALVSMQREVFDNNTGSYNNNKNNNNNEENNTNSPNNTKVSLIHGDYHPKNIYVSDHAITVIDLEESRVGNPAFDLGYFVAQFKMSFGFSRKIFDWVDIFIREYIEGLQLQSPSSTRDEDDYSGGAGLLKRQMKIYEAQTYLQRSYHTYWLLKLKPDIELVSKWLGQSQLCLEDAKGVENLGS